MKHVTLLINPAAGKQALIPSLDAILEKWRSVTKEVEVFYTRAPGDGLALILSLAEKTDLVIAAGGDGTVYECVNALAPLARRPLFGVLPCGTCNDFSRTLGIEQDPVDATEQLLRLRSKKVDVGQNGDHYFLNFWGIGLMTEVSDGVDSDIKKRWGRLAYYLSTLKHAQDPIPFALEVDADGFQYRGPATLLIAGNGTHLGGIPTFVPHGSVTDGQFDCLIVKEGGLWSLLPDFASRMAGGNGGKNVLTFRARELSVTTHPLLKADTDGEKHTYTPTHLSVIPRHLEVLTGEA
jgi:YegS/Rv2252/BmrU family lipid kinase